MNPVAFEMFGLSVRWYGILISIGMLFGTLLALREAKRVGLDENKIIDLILFTIPASIIGARTYYVIFNWEYYNGDIMKIINIRQGGLAIHGGIFLGVLVGYIFAKYNDLDFWKLTDIVAPSIILGQAIGRWGNYINQEAYGTPTDLPWAITVNRTKVHPTFLYESIWNLGVFIFLMIYKKKKKFEGEVFFLYLILYSIGRFFVEGLRIDSLMLGPFRANQVLSIVLVIIFSYLIIKKRSKLDSE